jgi:hypothetical protein
MNLLAIPESALPFILFQRTKLLALPNVRGYWRANMLINRFLPHWLFKQTIRWESRFRKKRVKLLYAQEIQTEYQSLRDYLPSECNSILDIGCGVAGVDALLYQHYGTPDIHIYLLDKTQINERPYHGFSVRPTFYNSLDVAHELLVANGVPAEQVHLVEASNEFQIPISSPMDLVLSTFSWGFHYPVSAYRDQVYDLLSEGGRLIMDIRRSTDGLQTLQQKFSRISIIDQGENHQRVSAQK